MGQTNDRKRSKKEMLRRKKKKLRLRVRKHNSLLLILFLAVVLLLNVLGLISKDQTFSDNENRTMASFPELTKEAVLDGSFMSDLESWFSDQFFARKSWITLKVTADRLMGKKESNGVYLGSSGYLMEVPSEPDEVWFDKNLDAINDFAARHSELNIYMSVIPNAAYILTDYAPSLAPIRDQSEDIQAIKDKLGAAVTFMDMTDTMSEHQSEGIYYKTDHHWTSLGAYYAFNAMASTLGIDNPATAYDIYTVTDSFQGTMASKSGVYSTTDAVQIYVPLVESNEFLVTYTDTGTETCSLYDSSALEAKDKYTVFFGGNHPMIDISTTNNNDRVLLLIKDSYANCMVQFLTPYFEKIIIVDPRYYYDDLESMISKQGVTDVFFLYNVNTYLEDTSLADTLAVSEEEDLSDVYADAVEAAGEGTDEDSETEETEETGEISEDEDAEGEDSDE